MTPDSQGLDSQDTLKRAQQGDRAAFAQLIDDHYDAMYRFAFKYCGNQQDAEDVTQQACIKLARTIVQFRFESSFTTWLYRIVVNVARDHYRVNDAPVESVESDIAIDAGAEHVVMLNQILLLVTQMGEEYRDTLVLVIAEGLSHAQAAEILAVKESTVSWRIHEIRRRLNAESQGDAP
jgi:RNA polymerase sigma-70 factor (ECF subfamily)